MNNRKLLHLQPAFHFQQYMQEFCLVERCTDKETIVSKYKKTSFVCEIVPPRVSSHHKRKQTHVLCCVAGKTFLSLSNGRLLVIRILIIIITLFCFTNVEINFGAVYSALCLYVVCQC